MSKDKNILLVEDGEVEAMTVQRALQELKVSNNLDIRKNGEEALEYLKKNTPFIILLDLNMPKMNGVEFLKEVKKDKELRKIPVIILTTSGEEKDKEVSFSNGAAGYIVKPLDYKTFVKVLDKVVSYWFASETAG